MVFYYPSKELQANLIGKFDTETISDHEGKYMRGRLATWTPPQKHTEFKIEEKDCQEALELVEEDTSLDDEIMREILEEEAARE
jgi:hypothetical protein